MAKKITRPKHTPPAKAEEQKPGGKSGRKTFDNTNRGALFVNDKQGNENRPDFTGTADIQIPDDAAPGDLVKFRLAGWSKTPNSGGEDYLSLQVQKADTQGGPKPATKAKGKGFGKK